MLRRPVEFTLAALVGVMNHIRGPALRERHVERLEDEPGAQGVAIAQPSTRRL